MLQIKEASIQDAAAVAQLYLDCFSESVEFFFSNQNRSRLGSIVTYGFELTLMSACFALTCRNHQGHLMGYCIVSTRDGLPLHRLLSPKKICKTIKLCFKSVTQLHSRELQKFAQNWWRFVKSSTGDDTPRKLPGGRIVSIAVHPGARGHGLGKSLLAQSLDFLEKHGVRATYLEVRPDNLPAKNLYESFGFYPYGHTEDLQGPWLRMVRVNKIPHFTTPSGDWVKT